MSRRKTQFLGFARWLWQELLQANEMGYIDRSVDDDPTDTPNYLEIIAEHVYDLAAHVASHTIIHAHGDMSKIPDLVEQVEEGKP